MILVTGGLGFIGSHIALSLMAQGQEVVLVDNLANSTLQTLERLEYISGMYVPFVKLDVRNTPALNKYLNSTQLMQSFIRLVLNLLKSLI